jgi:hypothetical protein
MQIRKSARLIAILVVATLASACNAGPGQVQGSPASPVNTNPPPSQPTFTPVPSTPTPASAAGLCANSLVPVKQGVTWTYTDSGAAGASSFTTAITSVRPDGFTASTRFDDNTAVDQQWTCQPEGLLAQSFGAGQTPLGLSLAGVQASIATSNATGVTLPANVQMGMKWPYSIGLAGTLAEGGLSADINGDVSTEFVAVGMESVTVPAGTFDAMKVEGTSTVKVAASYHGLSLPITSVVKTTFWFAPGVGWVKSSESGELAGTAISSVTELQSYNIP